MVKGLFFVFIGGLLASIPRFTPMLTFWFFFMGSIILAIAWWLDWDRKNNWPNSDGWFAILNGEQVQRYGLSSVQWSMGQQQKDQTFYLDILGSHRKPRVIKGFTLLQGLQHQFEYPEEWEITITDERAKPIDGYDKLRQRESRLGGGIEVEFDRPTAIGTVLIRCTVPRPERKWTVTGIEVKDCYLPGIWEKNVRFPNYI